MAKAKGYETMGITSTHVVEVNDPTDPRKLKYPGYPVECDHLFLIDDEKWGGFIDDEKMHLSPTTAAMIEISDAVIQIGGNEVGADEFLAAMHAANITQVIYIPAKMHPENDNTKTKGYGEASTRISKLR